MKKLPLLMAVLAWLAMALPATAARIMIDDRTDSITITWEGFDEGGATGGFSVNNDPNRTESGTKTVQEGQAITFDGKWRASAGPANAGDTKNGGGTINFLEPGTIVNDIGIISDILTISWSVTTNFQGAFLASVSGTFTSDTDPAGLGSDMGILETGLFQSVGFQSDVPNLGNPDHLFISVASDAAEPSTLALLGFGIAGVLLLRRRRNA